MPGDTLSAPLPFPPGCGEFDWVGCSRAALIEFMDAPYVTGGAFLRHLREYVRATPVTHNQRQLITAILTRCLEDAWYGDEPKTLAVDDRHAEAASLIARLTAGDRP
jgi:hypothetical protein